MNRGLEWMQGGDSLAPILFVLALLAIQPLAVRGAVVPGPISLGDARRIACERNWDLLAAAAGVDAAMAQKIVAREFPNPTLSMSTTLINVDNHPSSTVEGNGFWERSYDTVFAVNQLFEIGGKRRNRQASARAGFDQARAQFLDAKRTLELGVAKAYVAAALAERNASILTNSAASLHREAELAEVRLKAGEISESDRSQIQITAARFEQDAQAAQSAAAQARVALEVLLGEPHPKGEITLTDSVETLSASGVPSESASSAGRPDILAAEGALRKAEADLRVQKGYRVPDPTVLAQYEHEPPDNPNSVGFGVSLPLPLWNHNRGNIRAAEAARDQARIALQKTEAQAAADLATARISYEDARKRWQNYTDKIRPESEKVRSTLAYAYQKGGASLVDLLVVERGDNDVRLAAAQAAADTANAIAALQSATSDARPTMKAKQ
jgi:cobalt-zinc-cadmium efflux system outer membrane protein